MPAKKKTAAKRHFPPSGLRRSALKKKSKKKAAKKKAGWGGRRNGAGRPVGSGAGPSPLSRKNRVAVMFTDKELTALTKLAAKAGVPVATMAHMRIASRNFK